MKKVFLSLLLTLSLLLPTSVSGAGGASIAVAYGVFGGYTNMAFVAPKRYDGALWARAECYQETLVYVQYVNLEDDQPDIFTLGPTPSWTSGGADCIATLLVLNGYRKDREVAQTEFTVLP